MGKVKVLTARQAADLIKDGDTVTLSGFVANGIAEALNAAAEIHDRTSESDIILGSWYW